MMMVNSFVQQIPLLASVNLLAMGMETNRSSSYDPLIEIRNGINKFLVKKTKFVFF